MQSNAHSVSSLIRFQRGGGGGGHHHNKEKQGDLLITRRKRKFGCIILIKASESSNKEIHTGLRLSSP
jgi:hypothetical protein